MKSPIWETSPGALADLLNAMRTSLGSFTRAHLYTFDLAGGGQIAITDADVSIAVPGLGAALWTASGLRIDSENSRATAHWKAGLDVDEWIVTLLPRPKDEITGAAFPDKIGDVPFIQAAALGALDGAAVTVDRAYFAAWPSPWQRQITPVGVLRMFVGEPATVDVGDIRVVVTLRDARQKLSMKLPKGLYQAGCRHTLFDAGCQLVAGNFDTPGLVCLGGSTRALLKTAPSVPLGSATFTLGRVVMTSGANAGFQRTVRSWTGSTDFHLLNPLPFDIVVGDTFTAFPGCAKTGAACTAFGNLANFGGEPYIPAAETAL